jgi:uncharacterized protein YcfJ
MKRISTVLVVLAGLGAASFAQASGYISREYPPAGVRDYPAPDYADSGYGQPTYVEAGQLEPVADGSVHYGYGEVLEVQPIYRGVNTPASQQVCYDEPVEYYQPGRPRSPAGTLVGAILGGVIGNQLGRGGRGYYGDYRRDSATVAGAAIGGAIGYSASSGPTRVARGYEQRCRVETTWQRAEQVAGYDVTYRYRGEIYQTRTDQHPGDSIRVRVAVEPAY